jgi:hypothetical protein
VVASHRVRESLESLTVRVQQFNVSWAGQLGRETGHTFTPGRVAFMPVILSRADTEHVLCCYVYRSIRIALVGLAGLRFSFRRGREIRLRKIRRKRRRCSLTLTLDCFRPDGHRLCVRRYHPVRQVGLGITQA